MPHLAWQHFHYPFSRPVSDRLMLLVKMFAKLILLAFSEISDLHATSAMAEYVLERFADIESQKDVLALAPV